MNHLKYAGGPTVELLDVQIPAMLHANYWNLKLTTDMSSSVEIVSNLTAAKQINVELKSNRTEYRSQPQREA